MLEKQRIALRLSEVRQALNDLSDDAPDVDRDKLTTEYRELESRYRAAIITDSEDDAASESEPDSESTTPEQREYAQLLGAVEVTDYLTSAATGEPLTGGAALELRQHAFADASRDDLLPVEALLHRPVEGETQHRAAKDMPSNVTASDAPQDNQSAIASRVFARTASAFMGVRMPTVAAGSQTYVQLTGGATGDVRLDSMAMPALPATFSFKEINPVRLTAKYLFGIETTARLKGFEDALRADLRDTLSDKLDKLILNGQAAVNNMSPAVEGLLSETTDPDNPTVEAALLDYLNVYTGRVDGLHSEDGTNVRLLVNAATYQHARQKLYTATGQVLKSDDLSSARFRASANMPAAASMIAKGLSYTASERTGFVAPVWRGVSVIRDPYTKAGEGQVALTIVMLTGGAMVYSSVYAQHEFKLA